MPSDHQPLLPGIAPPRPRQVGRRCRFKHRHAHHLTGGYLWCPDCGALCPNWTPEQRPERLAWAYPDGTMKAARVDNLWAEQRKNASGGRERS